MNPRIARNPPSIPFLRITSNFLQHSNGKHQFIIIVSTFNFIVFWVWVTLLHAKIGKHHSGPNHSDHHPIWPLFVVYSTTSRSHRCLRNRGICFVRCRCRGDCCFFGPVVPSQIVAPIANSYVNVHSVKASVGVSADSAMLISVTPASSTGVRRIKASKLSDSRSFSTAPASRS